MIGFFEKHSVFSWFFVILMAGAIFYVSSLSFEPIPSPVTSIRAILYHFTVFFLLAFFFLIAMIKGKRSFVYFIFIVIAISLVYAVSDEFHQLFVPGRACSFSDFIVDSAGILLACFLYTIKIKFKK